MARFGSIPREGSTLEFLYEHRHFMSACERAEQQAAEGRGGLGAVAEGLQAVSPATVMLHMVWALAPQRSTRSTLTNAMFLYDDSMFCFLVLEMYGVDM